MSSRAFRSVIHRREHLERHQPAARARFGLLEKKKDYIVRAKNFHTKESRLKALRVKADNRNPDEFYFKMLNSKTKSGVHAAEVERGGKVSGDMLQVLRTQDRAYVNVVKGAEDRKIERLQSNLHVMSTSNPLNKHTVFLDSAKEVGTFDAAEYLGTDPALLGRTFNRPRRAQLEEGGGVTEEGLPTKEGRKAAKRARREKEKSYAELDARMERSEKLGKLAGHMELKKALLQKGRRTKVKEADGDSPAVYVWKAERKR